MACVSIQRAAGYLLAFLVTVGCATPADIIRRSPPIPPPILGAEATGRASWYGVPYHGRRTSSGEVYDMHQLTAAHRTLPLGTRVLVIHLENGRAVEVRINDRGPLKLERIIDLSYAAAQRLGAVEAGVVRVRLRVVSLPRSY
ncbi:MAG: septal ring lytic transglycosylase RlpA family protein [Candidatus Rokuibacteriota bacterium]